MQLRLTPALMSQIKGYNFNALTLIDLLSLWNSMFNFSNKYIEDFFFKLIDFLMGLFLRPAPV